MSNPITEDQIRRIVREEIAKAQSPIKMRRSSAPPCHVCVENDHVVKGTNFKEKPRVRKDGTVLRRVLCLDCKKTWHIEVFPS